MKLIHRLAAILLLAEGAEGLESADGLKDAPTLMCEDNGGFIRTRYVDNGVMRRMCVFEDNTACKEQCFYRGGCLKGAVPEFTSFCRMNEGRLLTREIDPVYFIPEVKWCVFEDGTACSEYAFGDDYCHKVGPQWKALRSQWWRIDDVIPFEMFCKVAGGEVVSRAYSWGTEDGQAPTEADDMCVFDVGPEAVLARMHPNQAEAFRSLAWIRPPEDTKDVSEMWVGEISYIASSCFGEIDMFPYDADESPREELLASINALLSEYCNDSGGKSEVMEDRDGDEYIVCAVGDNFCRALDLYYENCNEGVDRSPFPIFCEQTGGKLASDKKLCTYDHLLSEWVPVGGGPGGASWNTKYCTERVYYRWGCDVLGTSFPFDEAPTPSMMCDDEYRVEIHLGVDGSEYAICVRMGHSHLEVCSLWQFSPVEGVHCRRDMPPFDMYCREQNLWGHWGGELSSQTFDSIELPVCKFNKKFERNDDGSWTVTEDPDGIVCTERFYYDNGGCLPFDVHGAESWRGEGPRPPARPNGAAAASTWPLPLSVAGLLTLLMRN